MARDGINFILPDGTILEGVVAVDGTGAPYGGAVEAGARIVGKCYQLSDGTRLPIVVLVDDAGAPVAPF